MFKLGYPLDITGGKSLPIWKRGTVATEPVIDIDDLPKYLIDTATRSGMSGSPVVMQRTGFHGFNGNMITGEEIIGTVRQFGGIYSGRLGADNHFKAQLGIVWKPHVIEEIISGGKKGDLAFQNI